MQILRIFLDTTNNVKDLVQSGDNIFQEMDVFDKLLGAVYAVYAAFALKELYSLISVLTRQQAPASEKGTQYGAAGESIIMGTDGPLKSPVSPSDDKEKWSTLGIICLLLYRVYSGFNSATWLPYLLAKEGETLWSENQALFMGIAKLIYGLTMLTNPMCGLLGDKVVAVSHGIGRRFYVRWGVTLAASGIAICVLSDIYHSFYWFMFGIFVWRMGEAMNDVTIEALAPELLPQSQYAMAGGIKAFMFLMGGVMGYVMLIVLADVNFTWVYVAYLVAMPIGISPALFMLSNDGPMRSSRVAEAYEHSFKENLHRAYIEPFRIPGGFPLASVAVFVFSFGTGPMFFLLLMVRDLLGIDDDAQQQRVFAYLSIVFFLSAAVASILATQEGAISSEEERTEDEELKVKETALLRYARLKTSIILFGFVGIFLPFMVLIESQWWRSTYFFSMALLYGFFFGSAYSRFQDCTWMLLPPGVEMANVMGFNVMCRNSGIGLGNFMVGLILECYVVGGSSLYESLFESTDTNYSTAGYVWMCSISAVAAFASCHVTTMAAKQHFGGEEEQRALQGAVGTSST
mmetsp:Transcript_23583/g.42608  ORF Transcript_23583/g.42608 Transcript_23583/m.42608 type:complete len:574 (+) Transcript_23583:60-1781(+)